MPHVVLSGITQLFRGKMAKTQPFLDVFWILFVQMAELWPSPPERLRDPIYNHIVANEILWCSFVPQISKIGQEMAEL